MIPEHEVAEFAQDYKKANEIVLQKLEKSKAQVEVTLQKLAQKQGEYEYMKKQLAEHVAKIEQAESAAKQDLDNYKIMPKIFTGATIAACIFCTLIVSMSASAWQASGLYNEVLFLAGYACFFACFSCALTFAITRAKQHTIDYLQHLKPPKK